MPLNIKMELHDTQTLKLTEIKAISIMMLSGYMIVKAFVEFGHETSSYAEFKT